MKNEITISQVTIACRQFVRVGPHANEILKDDWQVTIACRQFVRVGQ